MNRKYHTRYLFLTLIKLLVASFFIQAAHAIEIINFRAESRVSSLLEPSIYNPVEAYNGEIRYSIASGGATVQAEYDDESYLVDYSSEIEAAVNYWRSILPNIYPGLTINHANQGEANFVIGYDPNIGIIGGDEDLEPAISYIPNTDNVNNIAMGNVSHGIYIDQSMTEILNNENVEMIMAAFSDAPNPSDAIKRCIFVLFYCSNL
ncbi:hypothetical protein [Xenorhabdus littoralis]|uniref:hypothetical protein n=1 Tax=Xenorhabdus littoralis TaxID=2582835 RepID=UPI0029E7F312|nr:hypothetical protein [Xenorhabdus sp. psl]MDX7992072.1 hypothetical protein [Xenorhabdus sp. psl]